MLIRRLDSGFSLVELMISIVAGMIVTGAMVAFVASTVANNAATLQSVRISQELRALADVVANDIRRARGVSDPIALVGSGCIARGRCGVPALQVVDDCAIYSYADVTGTMTFRSLRRASRAGAGELVLASSTRVARDCNSPGARISSEWVDITAFTINANPANRDQIDITIQGRLAGDPRSSIQTYNVTTFVRSGGA